MTSTPQKTIVAYAKEHAQQQPDATFLTFLEDGESQEALLTFGGLDQMAKKGSAWLNQQSVQPQDAILMVLPNGLDFVNAFFGCLYRGALPVPLVDPASPKHVGKYLKQLTPLFALTTPKVLLTSNALKPAFQEALADQPITVASVEDWASVNGTQAPEHTPQWSDVAYLQFTSGSTGVPKGVMVGHDNLMESLHAKVRYNILKQDEFVCSWLPLYHDMGLVYGVLGSVFLGKHTLLMHPAHFIRKPSRWFDAVSKYRCTASAAPQFAYDLCLKKVQEEDLKKWDLSCLNDLFNGAEPVNYVSFREFLEKFQACGLKPESLRAGYGMAEMVLLFSMSDRLEAIGVDQDELESRHHIVPSDNPSKYLVNCGPRLDTHTTLIVDPETLEPLDEGVIGEIVTQGPCVCHGYYKNEEATQKTFHNQIPGHSGSFLRTGDLGFLQGDDLHIACRIKDIIIIRGRNYHPQDIEHLVSQVEGVRVGCVAAFATTDAAGQEALGVAMEVRAELTEMPELFEKTILPGIDQKVMEEISEAFHIQPEMRVYLPAHAIDKTSSGKIRRQLARQKSHEQGYKQVLGVFPKVAVDSGSSTETSATSAESTASKASGVYEELQALFFEFAGQTPDLEIPCMSLKADSIALASFFDTLCDRYPAFSLDQVDEETTLKDIGDFLQSQQS